MTSFFSFSRPAIVVKREEGKKKIFEKREKI